MIQFTLSETHEDRYYCDVCEIKESKKIKGIFEIVVKGKISKYYICEKHSEQKTIDDLLQLR
ncbi:MAG: hypothetical protein HeimC2_29110 [Candidatus Heimdallarchaeota archaeon LC_2]|nr:MAG: hypothetical protein HeimC2_29110 [Candidatus Heimdallarchaeota archaeon LC_2]